MGDTRMNGLVASALQKKGFKQVRSTKHQQFAFFNSANQKTNVRTHVSFGKDEIRDGMLKKMAGQCKLDKQSFLNLVDCGLSHEAYEKLLAERGEI